MNDLLLIACGAGLHDGLNPCIFMTCAVFIVHGPWVRRWSYRVASARFVFVLAYALGVLSFNFGYAQIFVFQQRFILSAKVLYFLLGIWALVSGILFFKDWILTRRGLLAEERSKDIEPSFAGDAAALLTTMLLGLVLSALATLWPIDRYVLVLGNTALLKGQWQMVLPLLVGYVLVSMWAIWFVWAFLSIKNLRPSLYRIVCASVFFTATSCMILMFK